MDGRSSVADIVRSVEHDLFTTLGALLALYHTGSVRVSEEPIVADGEDSDGNGLSADERLKADAVVAAFNNIFAGIHERVATVKGNEGVERYAATLRKPAFQTTGIFEGLEFGRDGTLPVRLLLANVSRLPSDERMSKLKGSMDRLLAQQVRQLDTSYDADQKKAVSDLIAREKARLAEA